MKGRSRVVVIAMMLWWGFFGLVSVSWALGSPWLVDTVLQGDGQRLAQERPPWFVAVRLRHFRVRAPAPRCHQGTALAAPGLRLGFRSVAHSLWTVWFNPGNRATSVESTDLALRLVAAIPVDASLLGGWNPGRGRNSRIPALESARCR